MAAWVEGRVAGGVSGPPSSSRFRVEAPEVSFVPGQFARLALPGPPGDAEPMVGRPYSFVNPPHLQPHEFYLIVVPGGPLSPRLAALEMGDPIWLGARANGFFSLPRCRRRRCCGALPPARASDPSCRCCARRARGSASSAWCWCMPCATRWSSRIAMRYRTSRRHVPALSLRADGESRAASRRTRRTHPGGHRRRPPRGHRGSRAVCRRIRT